MLLALRSHTSTQHFQHLTLSTQHFQHLTLSTQHFQHPPLSTQHFHHPPLSTSTQPFHMTTHHYWNPQTSPQFFHLADYPQIDRVVMPSSWKDFNSVIRNLLCHATSGDVQDTRRNARQHARRMQKKTNLSAYPVNTTIKSMQVTSFNFN